ncbi:MAG: YihY/virulence factor BrkB family protein [Dehalococcoidia bacterium]|nr:YihY/virulence factor BrkB family protein [Dehalococcoidia bacterium]
MRVGNINVVQFGRDIYREYQDDDVAGLAAELTYRIFLAIFPFMIFLTALGGFLANALDINNPAQEFVDLFGDQLPSDAASVIEKQATEVVASRNLTLLSLGIVGTVFAATGGAGAVIKALNRAYDIPDSRPFWKQRLLALGLMLAASLAIITALSAFFATQVYGQKIADELGLGSAFALALRWGAIPLVIIVLMAATAFVYWAAPNAGLPFRWVSPGAVFFVLGWLVATIALSFYVANFGSYNATYGALGGVVVLLLWFYITSVILLLGAEINAVLDEQLNGPVLQERRANVAEALAARRRKQPRNPEAAIPAGATPATAAITAGRGGQAERNSGDPVRPGLASQQTAGAAGSVMALVGVIVAALALRRFAR